MNQNLLNFIAQSRVVGIADSEIRNQLLTQGWPETEINEALIGQTDSDKLSSSPANAQPDSLEYRPASQKRRFFNCLIDGLIISLLTVLMGGILSSIYSIPILLSMMFTFIPGLVYFTSFEYFLGLTPGKYLTKTKVITADGSILSLKVCIIRSLIRIIPIEFLSFLGEGIGWHDRWSGTLVVESASLPEPKRVGLWRFIFIIGAIPQTIAVLLACAVMSIIIFLNVFPGKDIPPPDDSAIRLPVLDIPNEQNGYLDLLAVKDQIYHPDSVFDLISGKRWDQKEAEDILQKNRAILEAVGVMLKKPYFQVPLYMDPANFYAGTDIKDIPDYLYLRNISRIVGLSARYLAFVGQPADAMTIVLLDLEFGSRMHASQISLIGYTLGNGIKVSTLRSTRNSFDHRDILKQDSLSPQMLIAYAEALKKYSNKAEDIERAVKMEGYYVDIDKALSQGLMKEFNAKYGIHAEDHMRKNFIFKPNLTRQIQIDYINENLKNSKDLCNAIKSTPFKSKILGEGGNISVPKFLHTAITGRNIVGEALMSLTLLDLSVSFIKKCESDFVLEAVRLAYSIRAFELVNKKLPATLTELVPKYISEVPIDPYDGEPMRYSASERRIYSGGFEGLESWWKPDKSGDPPRYDFEYKF